MASVAAAAVALGVADAGGMSTLSITWMTPLLARTSAVTTFAPPTVTVPPAATIGRLPPWTVFASVSFAASAASTCPDTTW